MRTNKGYLFHTCCDKGASHHHLHSAGIQSQVGLREALLWKKKKKKGRCQVCLIGDCWHEETGGG